MKRPRWFRVGLAGLLLGWSAACPAGAAVRLAGVFADGMVLQRGKAAAVWGTASPGEKVTVELARPVKLHLEGVPPEDAAFGGRGAVVLAGDDGTWRATLGPLAAGGPFVLEVSGTNRITCRDVLVGEVWVCCGGLNMADELRLGAGAAADVARADLPAIRYFAVPRGGRGRPGGPPGPRRLGGAAAGLRVGAGRVREEAGGLEGRG